jgi:hypothetical protein
MNKLDPKSPTPPATLGRQIIRAIEGKDILRLGYLVPRHEGPGVERGH